MPSVVETNRSSVGLERNSDKVEVGGSIPLGSTKSKETVMNTQAKVKQVVDQRWQYANAAARDI